MLSVVSSAADAFSSSPPAADGGFSAWAWVGRTGRRPQWSRPAVSDGARGFAQVLVTFCVFVLRPFARCAFGFVRTSDATTASAACPRVRACSFRARLWALQSVVRDFWTSHLPAHSSPTPCLTAHLCAFSRALASPPFRAACLRRRLGGSATVDVICPRRAPFSPQAQTPAGHTSAVL